MKIITEEFKFQKLVHLSVILPYEFMRKNGRL